MSNNNHPRRAGLLAILGVSTAAVLSGCGGATTNSGAAAGVATPTVYGVNVATGAAGSGIQFPSADGKTTLGGIVGAISSTATALEGAVALGFPAGALGADGQTAGQAVLAGQPSVIFGALIANGNISNASGAITGATLTSPEVSGFTQPLSFTGVGTGPIGSAGYTSPAFTLPFTTSGIHQFNVQVTDEGNQTSSTTLGVVVAVPTDVTLFLQTFDTGTMSTATATVPAAEVFNPITAGDIVQIDGGQGTGFYPTGYAATTADLQATVVLFAKPGTHTVTEFMPDGKTVVQTSKFTLPSTAAGTTIYAVPAPAATTTGSVSKPHLVVKHR